MSNYRKITERMGLRWLSKSGLFCAASATDIFFIYKHPLFTPVYENGLLSYITRRLQTVLPCARAVFAGITVRWYKHGSCYYGIVTKETCYRHLRLWVRKIKCWCYCRYAGWFPNVFVSATGRPHLVLLPLSKRLIFSLFWEADHFWEGEEIIPSVCATSSFFSVSDTNSFRKESGMCADV